MKTYELTAIISAQMSSEEVALAVKEVESAIQEKEGVILKSEKSAARSLAYPIKKQASGYFSLTEFQITEDKIKDLKAKLEKDNRVLRHLLVIKKPAKIMKERRTRKPLTLRPDMPPVLNKEEKKGEKAEMEEINKKLDEILSE